MKKKQQPPSPTIMSSNSPGRSSPTSSNTNLASSNSPTQLITTAPAVPPVSAAIPVPIVECKDVSEIYDLYFVCYELLFQTQILF